MQVKDFVCICDRAYTRQQILTMEKLVLNKLDWSLTVPTAYVFTVRFIKAADADEKVIIEYDGFTAGLLVY